MITELKTVSNAKAFGGMQGVYSHQSERCGCEMSFSVFLPPAAAVRACPVVWYLSGLTCSAMNVTEKGEFRRMAAEHGLIVVCPDTSPRGAHIPDDPGNWQFGVGAGFYVDATEMPYSLNYQMYSYIVSELPEIIAANFPVDMNRQGIFGHSMGGHGAMTIALKNPGRYKSCSAFAPIVQPMTANWSRPALRTFLGENEAAWRAYDSIALIEDGHRFGEFLVDQGDADGFLADGLRPWLLASACEQAGIPLTLRMQEGYDHSYFFVSTFMNDHLAWHAQRLG